MALTVGAWSELAVSVVVLITYALVDDWWMKRKSTKGGGRS
ncbi:hypothetical protein ACFP7A_00940 [Sporolactobacillus kofuensis]|uniref:Holin n=1 Tax=Sporolactobacillus kofuensis TaxID=269672 RepID=A0ABW1WA84_9BACL|nr:hypothetical protein [Sporolactobacillus kofuensis]